MTVINPNSISGITSITLPSGGDNVLTIHTNDGTERFRIDSSGNVKVGSAATISPDGDLFVTGVTTTGGHFAGSGANLTSLPAAQLTGSLPAISAASCTSIPAANIVGLATAGFNRSGGFPEGVTMADSWRITDDFTNNSQPISSNWERGDISPWEGYMGSSGLTESSGVFTFPSTGWYYVHYSHDFRTSSDVNWVYMGLELTNDSGSNWTNLSYAAGNNGYGDGDTTYHLSCQTSIFDITNVSTQKMRFYVERQSGTVTTQGNSNRNQTGFDIFRLGDT